jgi:hypothetical protein
MPQRRHTITVASSALFFVCLMFHAQTRLYSQTSIPCNDAESAYSVYESLLPADWTGAVAHARRLLLQTQIGTPCLRLKSGIESSALLQLFKSHSTGWKPLAERASHSAGSQITLYPVTGIFYTLESKDGIWTNLRWQGTSRAWAS